MKIFSKFSVIIVIAISVIGFAGPMSVFAATAPSLGSLLPYGVVSTTLTNSNTAPQTIINGSICATTHTVPGPLTVTGSTDTPCAPLKGTDLTEALAVINDQACTSLGVAVTLNNIAGTHPTGIYTPGCYSSSGLGATSMTIADNTTITLSGAGVYIFKSAGALKPGNNTSIILTNGATADKVFWAPVQATTIGANASFVGSILANSGITIGNFTTILGRALAFDGTVTTDANTITVPTILHVIKTVVNDNGGTSAAGAFSTTITGVTTATPTAAGVEDPGVDNVLTSVGAYTVDEGAHVGYTKTLSADCSGTIALGETKTCTITNNDIAPHLIVIKTVVNDNGGTSAAGAFSTTITGVTTATPTAAGVEDPGVDNVLTSVGAYTVDEGAHVGYTKTLSADCSGTIALGETKTCTITNNDIIPGVILPTSVSGGSYVWSAPPLIEVLKVPSPLALPSGPGLVTYTYTLNNIGAVPMTGITMVDDSCKSITYVSGDTNKNSKFDITETWTYTCQMNLAQTTTNVVVATGWTDGLYATDTASATVVVGQSLVPPLIHVVKKPSVFVLPIGGGAVTYTYTVTNPGTEPLSNVTITDNKCTGLPGRVVGHPGDLNKNNLLESNESWSFTCQTNLTQTTTNTGTVTGYANGMSAVDLSLATVLVISPKLPNTGIGPNDNNIPWNIVVLAGILMIVSTSTFVALRKRKI